MQGAGPRCSVCGNQFTSIESFKIKPSFAAFLKTTFEEYDEKDPWDWFCSSSDDDGLVGVYTLRADEYATERAISILGVTLASTSTYRPTMNASASHTKVLDAFKDMARVQRTLKVTDRPIELWLNATSC